MVSSVSSNQPRISCRIGFGPQGEYNKCPAYPSIIQYFVYIHREAQQELKQLLDTLSAKLKAIQKSQETPVVFEDYVRKLINVKHKVTVIYNVLNTSQVSKSLTINNDVKLYLDIFGQDRLNRVFRQVENEKTRRKVLVDSELTKAIQQPPATPSLGNLANLPLSWFYLFSVQNAMLLGVANLLNQTQKFVFYFC